MNNIQKLQEYKKKNKQRSIKILTFLDIILSKYKAMETAIISKDEELKYLRARVEDLLSKNGTLAGNIEALDKAIDEHLDTDDFAEVIVKAMEVVNKCIEDEK